MASPAGLFPLSSAIPDVPEHCTQTTLVTPKPLHVTVSQLSPKPPQAVKLYGFQQVPALLGRGKRGDCPKGAHQLRLQEGKSWGTKRVSNPSPLTYFSSQVLERPKPFTSPRLLSAPSIIP